MGESAIEKLGYSKEDMRLAELLMALNAELLKNGYYPISLTIKKTSISEPEFRYKDRLSGFKINQVVE